MHRRAKSLNAAAGPEMSPSQRFIQLLRKRKSAPDLYSAVMLNDIKRVRFLLQSGVDINEKVGEIGVTPIFSAVLRQNIPLIKLLVQEGADVNIKILRNFNPLILAIGLNNTEIVTCLLDLGADIQARIDRFDCSALHIAAEIGYTNIGQLLIKRGLDVNIRNKNKETPLHSAVKYGRGEFVKFLIANGADINAGAATICDWTGEDVFLGTNITPIYLAATFARTEVLKILLEAGVYVNAQTSTRNTALHAPAQNGWLKSVKMLINAKVDVNLKTEVERSALFLAAKYGNLKIVEALLDVEEIHVDAVDVDGLTPLHIAIENEFFDIVKCLVAKGTNVNAHFMPSDQFPLELAFRVAREDIVEFLIESGAYLGPIGHKKLTALHCAASAGSSISLTETLIKNGAVVDAKCVGGVTPLMLVAKNELSNESAPRDNVELFKYLISCGADPNATCNDDSMAPLHLAASYGSPKIVKYLVTIVKDINRKSYHGATALFMAAAHGDHKIVNILLRNGADPTIEDILRQKPLDMAARKGHSKVVEVLVKHRTNVNHTEGLLQQTPLFSAVIAGNIQIARSLLESGANVNAQDSAKRTPLLVACEQNLEEMALLFLKYGADLTVKGCDYTPLFHAVKAKSHKLVAALLERDANVNSPDKSGVLPIHIAARNADTTMVELLLSHGAYYNKESQAKLCKGTPLKFARKSGDAKLITMLELVKKLFSALTKSDAYQISCCIQAGAILNARNVEGKTALHQASQSDNTKAINSMLKRGADITLITDEGYVPLHYAVIFDSEKVVNILLKHAKTLTPRMRNKAINAKTTEGTTALHTAVVKNNRSVVQSLLEAGAVYNSLNSSGKPPICLTKSEPIQGTLKAAEKVFEILKNGNGSVEEMVPIIKCHKSVLNARDCDGGGTPLYWSAAKGREDITNLLLESGADCTLATDKGTTPLHIAASKGHVKIVKAILDQMLNENADPALDFIDIKTTKGTTPLHIASNKETVCCLLEAGAKYNARNREDKTPEETSSKEDIRNLLKTTHQLFLDVDLGLPEVMGTLNKLKVNEFKAVTGARNEEGKTLLQIAQTNNFVKLAGKLAVKMRSSD